MTASFVSGMSRWPNGGDYIGMTADADGVFHPFWTDGRSGTYQLYTAPIRVLAGGQPATPAPEKTAASLSDKVTLVFDPIQYDRQTQEVLLPVRLKNVSKETLYPPFKVEIKELAHPYSVKAREEVDIPTILNASNGKTGSARCSTTRRHCTTSSRSSRRRSPMRSSGASKRPRR